MKEYGMKGTKKIVRTSSECGDKAKKEAFPGRIKGLTRGKGLLIGGWEDLEAPAGWMDGQAAAAGLEDGHVGGGGVHQGIEDRKDGDKHM